MQKAHPLIWEALILISSRRDPSSFNDFLTKLSNRSIAWQAAGETFAGSNLIFFTTYSPSKSGYIAME
jgi:hypothetical protein